MAAPERPSSFFVPPTFAWAERVTGRKDWRPSFELIAFGMYVKRARHLVGMSQTRLEALSGVDQGQISRLERAIWDDDASGAAGGHERRAWTSLAAGLLPA